MKSIIENTLNKKWGFQSQSNYRGFFSLLLLKNKHLNKNTLEIILIGKNYYIYIFMHISNILTRESDLKKKDVILKININYKLN